MRDMTLFRVSVANLVMSGIVLETVSSGTQMEKERLVTLNVCKNNTVDVTCPIKNK